MDLFALLISFEISHYKMKFEKHAEEGRGEKPGYRSHVLIIKGGLICELVITEGNRQNQSHFWPASC